jgi:(p)ppGpp synthase/HD superfamily hydrolase
MNASEMTEWRIKASFFAREKHRTQKRKNGLSYYDGHLSPVADIVYEEYYNLIPNNDRCREIWGYYRELAIAVALLHDVLEDYQYTGVTLEDLKKEFPVPMIYESVEALTKREGESYFDFTCRINESKLVIAKAVKLADLKHNMSDLEEGHKKDKYRFAYYHLKYLNQ